ncbi:MAG: MerR family transcriptional regulator [Myxococcota bacterium]
MSSSTTNTERRMKIGTLARKTGKSVRALRHYEELGLLRAGRSDGGFRLYGPDELARVYWISKLQDMGFSLSQVQSLIATVEESGTAPEAMDSLREMFRSRLQRTRDQVERLLQLERDLAESLAYLEGCRACTHEHDVEGCATCDSPAHADTNTPSLVAGARPRTTATAPLVQLRPVSEPNPREGSGPETDQDTRPNQ